MTEKVVYVALTVLMFTLSMTHEFSCLLCLLVLFTWMRLIFLGDSRLIIWAILLSSLVYVRVTHMYAGSDLTMMDNTQLILDVKKTSYKVDGNKLTFIGTINTKGQDEEVMVNYFIKEEKEKERLVYLSPSSLVVEGTFAKPNEPTNFHQFNYKNYLGYKQIYYVLNASSVSLHHARNAPIFTKYGLDSIRQKIISHIDRTMSKRTGTYTKVLLFADQRTFPDEVLQSFKDLGVLHLLSISGLHVVLIINMLATSCRRLTVSKESTRLFLLITLPLYGITTGFGISVMRAIGQTWIKLFSECLRKSLSPLDCWSLVMVITLFINPYSLYTVGFQLSYVISFIIIMVTQQQYYNRLTKLKAYLLLNSILLLCSIPFLTYHFFEFSWGVLLMNSLFIPFVSLILIPLLSINFILSFIIPKTSFFILSTAIADHTIKIMEKLAEGMSSRFSFTVITGRLSPISYFIMAGLIVSLFLIKEYTKNNYAVLLPLLGIVICVFSRRYTPYGQVVMIDVGQGEAILIKEPWGRGRYLIDTGGQHHFPVEEWEQRDKEFSIGNNIVSPVLKSEGVHKLDSIIITHPDIDHYGALIDIISEIKTERIVSARSTYLQTDFQSLFPSIEKYGTIIKEVQEGETDYLPSNTIAVLATDTVSETNKNNQSLVILGEIGNKTWLFTGDLEIEGENYLLRKYPNLSVDVLKIGHHGSQTSTHDAFLNQLQPSVTWISCGENNRYGHPHSSVIENIMRADAMIYRTDQDGAIRYTFSDNILIRKRDQDLFSFEAMREQRGE